MKILMPLLALAALTLAGCASEAKAKVPTEPMGPSAPDFGSSEATSTVAGFLTGRWSPVVSQLGAEIDPEFAKQLGIDSLGDPNEVEVLVGRFWEFAPDGTFFYSEDGVDWKIKGHWTVGGNGVRLAYETYNATPLGDAKANLRKAAETGSPAAIAGEIKMENLFNDLERMTYCEVHKDLKRLHFKGEGATAGSFQALTSSTLMRMGFEK